MFALGAHFSRNSIFATRSGRALIQDPLGQGHVVPALGYTPLAVVLRARKTLRVEMGILSTLKRLLMESSTWDASLI
jgi:hypothetical protein